MPLSPQGAGRVASILPARQAWASMRRGRRVTVVFIEEGELRKVLDKTFSSAGPFKGPAPLEDALWSAPFWVPVPMPYRRCGRLHTRSRGSGMNLWYVKRHTGSPRPFGRGTRRQCPMRIGILRRSRGLSYSRLTVIVSITSSRHQRRRYHQYHTH